jgi:hypothetical protein
MRHNETHYERIVMHQVLGGKGMYVVEFDTMPELPITGLTPGEQMHQDLMYALTYPRGPLGTLGGRHMLNRPTYSEALTHAIETEVITEPGKYGIHLVPGTDNYEIYKIVE